jgi:hypothetical protein
VKTARMTSQYSPCECLKTGAVPIVLLAIMAFCFGFGQGRQQRRGTREEHRAAGFDDRSPVLPFCFRTRRSLAGAETARLV